MSQRIITPREVIPEEERVTTALDEGAIADHIEQYLIGDDNKDNCRVFSAVLGGVHLYCFAPSEILKRNYWTIFTMGLSGTKMNVPEDIEERDEYCYAELFCYLPPDWNFPTALGVGEEPNEFNWPLLQLKVLCSYVAATKAWIGEDHGLPNLLTEEVGTPFVPSTKLSHIILLGAYNENPGLQMLILENGIRINFYLMVPLTAAEAQWKRQVGAENSIHYIVGSKEEGGDAVMVDYVIDPLRPCCVDDLGAIEIFSNLELEDDGIAEEEEENEEKEDEEKEEKEDEEKQTGDEREAYFKERDGGKYEEK
jgi:hypothetical protein